MSDLSLSQFGIEDDNKKPAPPKKTAGDLSLSEFGLSPTAKGSTKATATPSTPPPVAPHPHRGNPYLEKTLSDAGMTFEQAKRVGATGLTEAVQRRKDAAAQSERLKAVQQAPNALMNPHNQAIQEPFRQHMRASGVTPGTAIKTLQERPLANMVALASGMKYEDAQRSIDEMTGFTGAGAQFLDMITDPQNVAIMMTVPELNPVVRRLVTGAFAVQMAHGTAQMATAVKPETWEKIKHGNFGKITYDEKKQLTLLGVTGLMAVGAGMHAKGTFEDLAKRLQEDKTHEQGIVRKANTAPTNVRSGSHPDQRVGGTHEGGTGKPVQAGTSVAKTAEARQAGSRQSEVAAKATETPVIPRTASTKPAEVRVGPKGTPVAPKPAEGAKSAPLPKEEVKAHATEERQVKEGATGKHQGDDRGGTRPETSRSSSVQPAKEGAGQEGKTEEEKVTGARNAITEAERAERGLTPVERQAYRGHEESALLGKQAIDSGKIDPVELARQVAQTPRNLDGTQTAALAVHRAQLYSQFNATSAELDTANSSGNTQDAGKHAMRLAQLEEQMDLNDQALVKGGREWSIAGRARQLIVTHEGDLAAVTTMAKRMKGAPLTPQETTEYKGLVAKFNEAQSRIAELEKQQSTYEKRQAKVDATKGTRQATNPRTREFGKSNKLITADAAEEARARIRAKAGRLSAGVDPESLKDLAIIGGYYIEGGLREFGAWATRMKEEHPDLSEGDLQAVWTNARSELADRGNKTMKPPSDVFVDRLAQRLGRSNATSMVNALNETHPELLDKMLKGEDLSEEERNRIAEEYRANAPSRGGKIKPNEAMQIVSAAVKETADVARLTKQVGQLQHQVATGEFKQPAKRLPKEYTGKMAELIAERDSLKREIRAKMYNKVPGFLDNLSTLRKAGLLSGPFTVSKIAASHASYLLTEEVSRIPASLVDMAASAVSGKDRMAGRASATAMIRSAKVAATTGVRDAMTIFFKGEKGLAARRQAEGDTRPHVGGETMSQVHTEFNSKSRILNGYVNGVLRSHGAMYEVMKSYAMHRALEEQANLGAINEVRAMKRAGMDVPKDYLANRTKALMASPSDTMVANAIASAEEATFINSSKGSDWLRTIKRDSGAVGRFGMDLFVPFPKVPTNVVARAMEYTPGGIVNSLVIAGKALRKAEITPEMQRRMAQLAGRGSVGTVTLSLGYLLAKGGALTPNTEDRFEGGQLLLMGNPVQIGNVSPVGNLLAAGANIYYLQNAPVDKKSGDVQKMLYNFVAEQPALSGISGVDALLDAMKHGRIAVPAGRVAGSFVPTASAQVAAHFDKVARQDKGFTDPIKSRIIGLRGTVPPKGAKGGKSTDPAERMQKAQERKIKRMENPTTR